VSIIPDPEADPRMPETWRRCSACKQDIPLKGVHYVCSVSTCNRKRTGLVFCSVDCWEIHLPTERHREAWAVEARAPATPEPAAPATEARQSRTGGSSRSGPGESPRTQTAPPRTIIRRRNEASAAGGASGTSGAPAADGAQNGPQSALRSHPAERAATTSRLRDDGGEILVVASKLKQYVKDVSGFNTSDKVLPLLSTALRRICDEAIENARRAERFTVMDRDVPRD
jgi:hypothetical protein